MRHHLALLLAGFGGCASGGFVERFAETRDLLAREPAAFAVAVAPLRTAAGIDLAIAAGPAGGGPEALRASLLGDLVHLRAASRVEAVGDDDLDDAVRREADLLLRPRIVALHYEYLGGSRDGLLSSLLWLTTWVGGLFVADADYLAGLQIDWEVVNPHNGQVIASLAGTTRSCRLGFFDRNPFASVGTLETLVWPPAFTTDDAAVIARSLTAAAVAHAAGEMARYLKEGLAGEERELLGELRLESPRNGDVVATGCVLRGALIARDLVAELSVYVNGELAAAIAGEAMPQRSRQQVGASTYRVALPELPLALVDGDNTIVIDYIAAGRRSSRTLVVRGAGEGRP